MDARPGMDRAAPGLSINEFRRIMTLDVSIVIPTYNEVSLIGHLLARLHDTAPGSEVIVADGGSEDGTIDAVGERAVVIRAEKGRAIQMNAGARAATGNVLWFLHADCQPPDRAVELIRSALEDESVVGGGFRWGLEPSTWYYEFCTRAAHLKNRLRKNLFGDMGIFVRTDIFNGLGGYAEIPLMEEVEFNRRLRRKGRTVILDEVLRSSDRKLAKEGWLWAFIKNDIIKAAYALGFSPHFLAKFY